MSWDKSAFGQRVLIENSERFSTIERHVKFEVEDWYIGKKLWMKFQLSDGIYFIEKNIVFHFYCKTESIEL